MKSKEKVKMVISEFLEYNNNVIPKLYKNDNLPMFVVRNIINGKMYFFENFELAEEFYDKYCDGYLMSKYHDIIKIDWYN